MGVDEAYHVLRRRAGGGSVRGTAGGRRRVGTTDGEKEDRCDRFSAFCEYVVHGPLVRHGAALKRCVCALPMLQTTWRGAY